MRPAGLLSVRVRVRTSDGRVQVLQRSGHRPGGPGLRHVRAAGEHLRDAGEGVRGQPLDVRGRGGLEEAGEDGRGAAADGLRLARLWAGTEGERWGLGAVSCMGDSAA